MICHPLPASPPRAASSSWLIWTAMAAVSLTATQPARAEMRAETKDPIKLHLIQAADSDFIVTVFAEVLKKVGYKVELQTVDYAAHFTAVANGDLTASVTGWPNYPELKADAMASGKVDDYGGLGVQIREGWWYPEYVAKLCPGLPNWEALKTPECVKALSTAETQPKGRIIDAPADWATNSDKRVTALGLGFAMVNPGSAVALNAALQGSIDKKEPVLGWGIHPYWVTARNKGDWVKLPAFEPACITDPAWGPNPNATYDCDWMAGEVFKFGHREKMAKAPNAAKLLRAFKMTSTDVASATIAIDVESKSMEAVVADWMSKNAATVDAWLK
jgi:glycine betaine/proline transport system substrate-binding protein